MDTDFIFYGLCNNDNKTLYNGLSARVKNYLKDNYDKLFIDRVIENVFIALKTTFKNFKPRDKEEMENCLIVAINMYIVNFG